MATTIPVVITYDHEKPRSPPIRNGSLIVSIVQLRPSGEVAVIVSIRRLYSG
jgi:hypothetical protein